MRNQTELQISNYGMSDYTRPKTNVLTALVLFFFVFAINREVIGVIYMRIQILNYGTSDYARRKRNVSMAPVLFSFCL